jgi:hypothetical protein
MKNERPTGQTVRDLLETALEKSLTGNAAATLSRTADDAGSPVVVGEIVDTHHPHLPSRVLVHWWPSGDKEESAWLHHERHLALRKGDRVLVTLPLGWSEWVVTGALTRGAAPASEEGAVSPPPALDAEARELRLEPGQSVMVIGSDGAPLLRVHQGPQGPIIELERDQVELKARRRLRLSADTVEIAAGQGGIDVRSDGDAVVRAHAIRLN